MTIRKATTQAFIGALRRAVGDLRVIEEDCGTTDGIDVRPGRRSRSGWEEPHISRNLPAQQLLGRVLQENLPYKSDDSMIRRSEVIDGEALAKMPPDPPEGVYVRSPLTCEAVEGVCARCCGQDDGVFPAEGTRVGAGFVDQLAAALAPLRTSAGEQRAFMRNHGVYRGWHIGGVPDPPDPPGDRPAAGSPLRTRDIPGPLLRVASLLEARRPRKPAVLSEIDGILSLDRDAGGDVWAEVTPEGGGRRERYKLPRRIELDSREGAFVLAGEGSWRHRTAARSPRAGVGRGVLE